MAVHLKPLDQQVMVLTGASSGIGLCTAILAAERGAKLVLVARSEDTLQELVSQIKSNGGDAIYVTADVADREQMLDVALAAVNQYGRIDTWVNDAGVSSYSRLDEISEADSRRIFDTNFWGVVNGSLVALPYLRKQGGALINLGSEVSEAAAPLLVSIKRNAFPKPSVNFSKSSLYRKILCFSKLKSPLGRITFLLSVIIR